MFSKRLHSESGTEMISLRLFLILVTKREGYYSSSECEISKHAEALLFGVCRGSNLPVSETMTEFSAVGVCVVSGYLV